MEVRKPREDGPLPTGNGRRADTDLASEKGLEVAEIPAVADDPGVWQRASGESEELEEPNNTGARRRE
jgi:hypothetical protein